MNAALEQLFMLSGSLEPPTKQQSSSSHVVSELDDFDVREVDEIPSQQQTGNLSETRHGHHLPSPHQNSGSSFQHRAGIVKPEKEPFIQSEEDLSILLHGNETLKPIATISSTPSSSESRAGFIFQDEEKQDLAKWKKISHASNVDHSVFPEGHTNPSLAPFAANQHGSFPVSTSLGPDFETQFPDKPESSGLGEFKGSLQVFLEHVLTSDESEERHTSDTNARQVPPAAGLTCSKPLKATTSSNKGRETTQNTTGGSGSSTSQNYPNSIPYRTSTSETTELPPFPDFLMSFHNPNLENPSHTKQTVPTSTQVHADGKSSSDKEKRPSNTTVKLTQHPPLIQRLHQPYNFADSLAREHSHTLQPGSGPPRNVRQPMNFNRGTTWNPQRFIHRLPLLPQTQQFPRAGLFCPFDVHDALCNEILGGALGFFRGRE